MNSCICYLYLQLHIIMVWSTSAVKIAIRTILSKSPSMANFVLAIRLHRYSSSLDPSYFSLRLPCFPSSVFITSSTPVILIICVPMGTRKLTQAWAAWNNVLVLSLYEEYVGCHAGGDKRARDKEEAYNLYFTLIVLCKTMSWFFIPNSMFLL